MKKQKKKWFYASLGTLTAFVLWTAAVGLIDVRTIGPNGSAVGFATINRFFHSLTGVHMSLYVITDWLGLIPLAFALGFALLGLIQWTKRKSLFKVDRSILILGGFYLVVTVAYAFFEIFVINYRPVLIGGVLEASYPSSTTLLVMCIMPTAAMQLYARIKNNILRSCTTFVINAFTVFMVAARSISGVHWFSDIIGGALLSGTLVFMYAFFAGHND